VHAFSNEGLLDHSLHTVIINREGYLVANIEGNQFTATQLGDVTAGIGVLGVAKTMMGEIFGTTLPTVVTSSFAATFVLLGGRLALESR